MLYPPPSIVGAEDIQTVGIKEPFRKLTTPEAIEKSNENHGKRVLVGVKYRFDKQICLLETALGTDSFEEAPRWSPASQLPEFAIRRYANVESISAAIPLHAFTEDDIKLMCLDYASQDNPQLLIEEYLPIKNYELLFSWWKGHYKSTLKESNDPMAVIVYLTGQK